ncbi:MAG: radical SAM protein, partial [Dethiosulfovibrio sp.]|nr:radical SAM protein [Dethiosulfovibrio sp.]
MHHWINEKTLLVYGDAKDAIYDFNKGLLFNFDKKTTFLIEKNIRKETTPCDIKASHKIDFAWIQVTEKCNLRCCHCYEGEHPTAIDMTLNDFLYVVDELIHNKISRLQIIGGEPLVLGTTLEKMLDILHGHFSKIDIFTNCTLLNNQWINIFKQNNISKILTSVYSYIPSEHDKVTGIIGSHKSTCEGLRILREKGIDTTVKHIKLSNVLIGTKDTDLFNLDEKYDLVRLVGRGGLDQINDSLLTEKLITKNSFSGKIIKSKVLAAMSGHNCFSRGIFVSSNLDIYPCAMERRFSHGNIKRNRLSTVINDDILRMSKDFVQECS